MFIAIVLGLTTEGMYKGHPEVMAVFTGDTWDEAYNQVLARPDLRYRTCSVHEVKSNA